MTSKLDYGQLHILRLAQRDAGEDGWSPVSKTLWPHISRNLPDELLEKEALDDGRGRVRLTHDGAVVLKWSKP